MKKEYRSRAVWSFAFWLLATTAFAQDVGLRLAHPQVPPQIVGRAPIGRLAPETPLSVTVVLPIRDPAALDQLIADQHNPVSPQFLRYLTPQEFADRFGPLPSDYAAVQSYLTREGLRVTGTTISRTAITATGPAGQIERAFSVNLNRYLWNGRTIYANDRTPSLPASLNVQGLVSVQGLSNAELMQPRDAGRPPFTPSAINKIYNYQGLRNLGVDGTGQQIAIYSLADYSNTNVSHWASTVLQQASPPSSATFNTANIVHVPVDGGTTTYSEETDMDVELVLGTVPGAQIQVWLGPNGSNAVFDIYSKFANQTAVKIMTSSWGIGEDQMTAADFDAYHQVFQQAASQGLTIFNSSGDNGSNEAQNGGVAVSHPASDPDVVAVGGTNVYTPAGQDVYDHETGWGGTTSGQVTGSGGGLSTYFAKPSWQTGPGVQNASSNGKRQLPDVSMNASPSTGYLVYFTYQGTTDWFYGGGTSASAPEWAAGLLLIQQALGKSFFLSPLVYQAFTNANAGLPFHDVTVGNNGLYDCTPGWDYVTGCGSVDFLGLKNALAPLVNPGTPGDVDGNGVVNALDVRAMLQVVGGLAPANSSILTYGDMNHDGHITISDAVAIARIANGLK